MGEEFEAGICGGNNYWWINNMMMVNSTASRSVLPLMMSSSPCSVLTDNNDLSGGATIGYSTWQTDTVDLKSSPSTITAVASSCSDISLGFLDATATTKPLLQNSEADAPSADNHHQNKGSMLMDSSLEMIMAWNHSLLGNFSSQSQDQKRDQISTKNQDFSVGSYEYPCVSSSNNNSSSSSTLIESLYDIPHQPQSLFTNPASMAYSSSTPNNYGAISNSSTDQFVMHSPTITTNTTTTSSPPPPPPSWSRPSNQNNNSFLKSNHGSGLHFSNCTPFWNAPAETPHVFASSLIAEKLNFPSSLIPKLKREEASDSAKKSSCEPAIKKQRIETPSPLPTFKVRKEKLGDRITALQQMVSPFGKTDTASVLHEAIEYIKFLHDQVLSTPYMKNGVPIQHYQQELSEGPRQDLRSRGLCLVPISSTFPVTNETPVDFWTPSFGGTLIR